MLSQQMYLKLIVLPIINIISSDDYPVIYFHYYVIIL